MQVPAIKITRIKYHLNVANEKKFSLFPEAVIRGALGYILFEWANVLIKYDFRKASQCVCLYESLVGAFPNIERMSLEPTPPKTGMLQVKKDELKENSFELLVTLFGEKEKLIDLFTEALVALSKEGIGKKSILFFVDKNISYQVGYLRDFIKRDFSFEKKDIILNFVSPTTLKEYGGRFLYNWSSDAFARNLYNRVALLCKTLDLDFCFELSLEKFCLLFNSLEYLSQTFVVSRKRFSSRQQRRIDYSGFQGEVYLKNVPLEVIEFLLYGEILAVGKNTSFGAGCYQLKILNR